MHDREVAVTFQPLGKTVRAAAGTRLSEIAAGAGIALDLPCGGEGICGKCRVAVRRGAPPPGAAEQRVFSQEELGKGWRLACQTVVRDAMTVVVPETSLLASYHKILADVRGTTETAIDPPVRKQYVELPPPDRKNDEADLLRIQRAVGPIEVGLELARELPGRLRREAFRGTAVLADRDLIDFEAGDTRAMCHAAAFDIGTTTLVGMLVDLNTGEELAIASRLNPQTAVGDDVLTRILHTQKDPAGLAELQEMVVAAVNEMIGELAADADAPRESIYAVSFSGNTTMQQLLLALDSRWLGEVPFVPAAGRGLLVEARTLGLRVHPRARAHILPVIGGFVGGDTVSGILATGLAAAESPSLLVDIGTNGEIVLAADGKLSAAATAAGPAFEGARIEHGMRGARGAIERVTVDGGLQFDVIGNVPAIGICGSALIDLGAELLRHRIISPEGRMAAPDQLPGDVLPDMRNRVVADNGQVSFLVAAETETATGRPVVLTQRDVRQLQLASGAIRAGIVILLRRAGLEPRDLKQVLIAGGFGNFIRRRNAQRIGLLPNEIDPKCIRYEGNTSLAGARLTAISASARAAAEELARRTEHVDLATDHGFQWAFADAMIFPEGE
ncbi:MAG: DUF4445 domain-containing protein [Pirellulales bacterium]|nr:DUF4445 domain-containing protein [Pirellulales bacterium]